MVQWDSPVVHVRHMLVCVCACARMDTHCAGSRVGYVCSLWALIFADSFERDCFEIYLQRRTLLHAGTVPLIGEDNTDKVLLPDVQPCSRLKPGPVKASVAVCFPPSRVRTRRMCVESWGASAFTAVESCAALGFSSWGEHPSCPQ